MTGVDADLATLREFLAAVEPTGNVELIYTSALPRVVPAHAALDRVEAELARLTARRSRYAEARYENCMEALSAAEAEAARLREERDAARDAIKTAVEHWPGEAHLGTAYYALTDALPEVGEK